MFDDYPLMTNLTDWVKGRFRLVESNSKSERWRMETHSEAGI